MKPDIRIGWILVCFLAALSLVCGLAGMAHADASTLADRIEAVAPAYASKKGEPVDFHELAEAIAATTSDRQWAALELAVMANESALSARIARGEFKDHEADPYRLKDGTIAHKAWGLGQLHANKLNAAAWGSPDIGVQVTETSKALRRGFYTCQNRGSKLRPDWVARTINGFAGRRCDAQWPGLQKRLAAHAKIVGRL